MTLTFSIEDKESLLNTSSVKERVMLALKLLYREEQLQRIKQDIRMKTREDLDEQQREYFLQQQIKNIKDSENRPLQRIHDTRRTGTSLRKYEKARD